MDGWKKVSKPCAEPKCKGRVWFKMTDSPPAVEPDVAPCDACGTEHNVAIDPYEGDVTVCRVAPRPTTAMRVPNTIDRLFPVAPSLPTCLRQSPPSSLM